MWIEDAAHHGPIYELKWSRDDKFLLSCSGDGTSKVWDMTPTAFRSSNTMGFGVLNNTTATNISTTSAAAAAAAVGGGGLHSSFDGAQPAGSKPPSLLFSLVTSPPVYTYTGVFQDQISPIQVGGWTDPTGRTRVPRIITGSADGKLRVWDGPELRGLVVVNNKDKDTGDGDVDYSPHEGQINSIVIDERSR